MVLTVKPQHHPRNAHKNGYDFDALCQSYPQLKPHVFINQYSKQTIDFSDSQAVIALNTALLRHHYNINEWSIPKGFLCPAIPGRADYIHYLADLLKETNNNKPAFKNVTALDIGTGASCIYSLLGNRIYDWKMVASDIDPKSIDNANAIIKANQALSNQIDCRLQTSEKYIFRNIIHNDEYFDITLCNPPFHESIEQGMSGTQRKWNNLNKSKDRNKKSEVLNFGGQNAELWCKGGELSFVKNMIKESRSYSKQVLWFTSLISKKDNVSKLKLALKKANAIETKVIKMEQGNKISRFIAWSFLTDDERSDWCQKRFE
ncbi:23S rRNA (adenine(1618)-N(6))-methyltransferase RlmF [Bermanella marisrubri]|nr:23S rRNA (adenine(1618)-N(6))-methyltransferase RlmF [Bermanella marisrubri]